MSSTLKPEDAAQLHDAVKWAVAEEKPLDIIGLGTKHEIGRPAQHEFTLDLSALTGVTLYEPEELVLSAHAATPRAEVEQLLRDKNQEFAFEPPDLSALLGASGPGTLGGMVASNLAGPRRIKAGAVRDHFLGFSGVSGRGESFKSGGRVVKNVTGYDLPKIIAGSWGTLAVLSDITLKVLPAAETERSFALEGLSDEVAVDAMSRAFQSSCEVSGAAHLPQGLLGDAATVFRIEGIGPSVEYRLEKLSELLKNLGSSEKLDTEASKDLWRSIRDVSFFANGSDRPVWRLSVPPTDGAKVAADIADRCEARWFFDWAGGLIWCEVPEADNASEQIVRAAVAQTSGHATLIRAPQAIRAAVDVFQPPEPGLALITQNVKAAFDPKGILNPGRMYASA
ncbi:MAG: glycolate oxidase subunit GlcE [Pseudomonadota bacterium]